MSAQPPVIINVFLSIRAAGGDFFVTLLLKCY